MLQINDSFTKVFRLSQEDVNTFARISGDQNPVHLDKAYAKNTPYKKPIIHGFLAGSVFSRIIGMEFPGEGTVYLKQNLVFRRPMYVDTDYQAVLTITEIDSRRGNAKIDTRILGLEDQKPTITGEAWVMNKEKLSSSEG